MPNGTRQQYGLPYQRLPATRRDLTPESMLQQEIQTGRQQIQSKYALQWKEVNRSRRFIGAGKAQRMLREIDTRAKQEMLQFNQQAQQQLTQLRNIDRLAQQGAITNPEEIKARIAFGTDVARSMYPKPERERSVALQFGELDVYGRRVENVLAQFRRKKERIKKWYWGEEKESIRLGKVQIYDIDAGKPELNEKTGKMEYWRNASPEEIQTRNMYLSIQEGIKKDKARLFKQLDISRRIVQPGTKGGTFSDKVAESIPKPVTEQRRQPAMAELRRQGTREAYERGKRLGYWE